MLNCNMSSVILYSFSNARPQGCAPVLDCALTNQRQISTVVHCTPWFPYQAGLFFQLNAKIAHIALELNRCAEVSGTILAVSFPSARTYVWSSVDISAVLIPVDVVASYISSTVIQGQITVTVSRNLSLNIIAVALESCYFVIFYEGSSVSDWNSWARGCLLYTSDAADE